MANEEKWERIVQLHQHIKYLTILAEEVEFSEWKKFIQPAMEEVSGFDHICRAKAAELGFILDLDGPEKTDYIDKNLDKALGHMYRGFFDAADWMGVALREKIIKLLEPYPADCISANFPGYYEEVRPFVEGVALEIADIRKNKDIASNDKWDELIEHYNQIIDDLTKYYKKVATQSVSFEKWLKRYRQQEAKKLFKSIAMSMIVTMLVVLSGLSLFVKGKPSILIFAVAVSVSAIMAAIAGFYRYKRSSENKKCPNVNLETQFSSNLDDESNGESTEHD